jgi:hypothetical protein
VWIRGGWNWPRTLLDGVFFVLVLQPLWALASFQFPDLFTIGRTPWRSDQLVARPLPKYRTA